MAEAVSTTDPTPRRNLERDAIRNIPMDFQAVSRRTLIGTAGKAALVAPLVAVPVVAMASAPTIHEPLLELDRRRRDMLAWRKVSNFDDLGTDAEFDAYLDQLGDIEDAIMATPAARTPDDRSAR